MNGYCDIAIIGTGFGQKLGQQFATYANLVKNNLLKREPFFSRSSEIRFHIYNSKKNLNCKLIANGLDESLQCTSQSVASTLKGTGIVFNLALVIDWLNGYGGANSNIGAVGVNQLIDPFAGDSNYCTKDIIQRAFDGLIIHEGGHGMGLPHAFDPPNPPNVMSFATNGGCDLAGQPFLPEHQIIINSFIDIAKLQTA